MKIVAAKVLCLLGICVLMLAGSLLPVKIIQADHEKAHRSRKVISLCNSFGGGVFLATCFNALLPAVRGKVTVCVSPAEDSADLLPYGDGAVGSVSNQSGPLSPHLPFRCCLVGKLDLFGAGGG